MTLSETEKLDIVAKSKQGEIVLVISAFQDWNADPDMLKDLDKKLQNYISYIESDKYTEEYGNSPVFIEIVSVHQFSPEAIKLAEKVQMASGVDVKTTVMGGAFSNPFS